jgi:hypothetical protein
METRTGNLSSCTGSAIFFNLEDIMGKGVTHNFNTKPNEKLHGPLKAHYCDHTNFKDVASQVGFLCTISIASHIQ